ncbi:hypothetical protein QYB28_002952 [Clostridium perfringens]|nr:hypothetical protein [Clostridium perfringens]
MSKLNIKLSYKNACILKHALRDKIASKQRMLNYLKPYNHELDKSIIAKWEKEIEEEKRTLAAITEEIEKHRKGFTKKRRI